MIPNVKKYTSVVRNQLPCAVNKSTTAKEMWQIFVIKNSSATAKQAVLFDGSGLLQLNAGYASQDGISITCKTTNYTGILRNLASGEQYCYDKTEVEILAGTVEQFENPWKIYEAVDGTNGVNLIQEIHPSIAKDAYQQQADRLSVQSPISITRKRGFVVNMEPETTMVLRMRLSVALTTG